MQALQSDIISLETYFESLVTEHPGLKSFVLETSPNPFELERLDELAKTDSFSYPALAMLMPIIEGEDACSHDFSAHQTVAFSCMAATDGSHADKLQKYKSMQLAAWQIIKYLRRDSKKGILRLDNVTYKMASMEYGTDNAVGYYVIITLVTNTNSLIGSA